MDMPVVDCVLIMWLLSDRFVILGVFYVTFDMKWWIDYFL